MWRALAAFLGRGSRSAPVESDQPGRHFRSDESGFRSRVDESCPGTPPHLRPALSVCGSPDRGMVQRKAISAPLSRRQLLVAGLTAGAAALVGAPVAGAAPEVAVWGLDPSAGREGCGCSGCVACRAHAANKIFASAAAADAGRAHPRCKCAVAQIDTVDSSVYEALFVEGGARTSVDRRRQWVVAALASTSPVAPPPDPAPPTVDPQPPASVGPTHPFAVWPASSPAMPGPILRSAWVRREPPARRVLYVRLASAVPVEATVALVPGLAGGPVGVRRRVRVTGGRRTVQMALAAGVAHGPAQLSVKFRDESGRTRHVTRLVSIPARQVRRT